MTASFVAQREVFITRPPVPMFSFHAIALWKIEEGIDKLFLHVWNDVTSTVINLNAIKFLSEGTKGIQSTCRWLAIFTEYLFRSLVSNDSVYILLTPLKTAWEMKITWPNTWPSWSELWPQGKLSYGKYCFGAIGCIFAEIWPINFLTQFTLLSQA